MFCIKSYLSYFLLGLRRFSLILWPIFRLPFLIPARSFAHNIMVCQEISRGYDRKGSKMHFQNGLIESLWHGGWITPFCWHLYVLFPAVFVEWVMYCLTTASYSISFNQINGEVKLLVFFVEWGRVIPSLLSSFLLDYCGNAAQKSLQSYWWALTYHRRCRKLRNFSIIFADDILLYCKADMNSLSCILAAFLGLEELKNASGMVYKL